MNCIRDTCVIEPTLLSLQNETVQSLQAYCKRYRINAFTEVDSSTCQHLLINDYFKLIKDNTLVYFSSFTTIDNFTLANSIINDGNIIYFNDRYYLINKNKLDEVDSSSFKKIFPYIESFLGYTDKEEIIKTCYIKILTTQDAYYHIVFDNKSVIQIAPELPCRYPLDFYVQTIKNISKIIKPSALTKIVQLSADVYKEVIC